MSTLLALLALIPVLSVRLVSAQAMKNATRRKRCKGKGLMAEFCSESGAFPTNYDGEMTRCPECGRKLKLHVSGRVPKHNSTPPKPPKLLPRGESWVDGRLCGTAQNRAPGATP